MKTARIFIVFTFLLAFAVCVSAQRSKPVKANTLKLSLSDKSEIVNQIFDDGFAKLMENS